MKSKTIAYLLLICLGIFGAHRFYIDKTTSGILYLLTCGIFGIGIIIDIFTLGSMVDLYNATHMNRINNNNNNNNTIVVNVEKQN